MSISVLGTPRLGRTDRGWKVQGYFQFSTTDLTGYLPINSQCPRILGGIKLTPQGPTAFTGGATTPVQFGVGTVSASAGFLMNAPVTGAIASASFTVDTTVATDAANIWTVGILNVTQTLTPVDIATAANSNNSTGGTAFTADVPRALTLGVAAQLAVTQGDILEWTFTKASSAANLVELNLSMRITPTGGATGGASISEQVYADVASLIATTGSTAGYLVPVVTTAITPNGLAVPIVRRGNPTSGLICAFEYEGF